MVLAYAVMGSGVWLLPFFMPWFAYLPLLLAVLFTYRYVLQAPHTYHTERYWERRLSAAFHTADPAPDTHGLSHLLSCA